MTQAMINSRLRGYFQGRTVSMNKRWGVWILVCLTALLCASVGPAFANELASISGRITDSQGLVLPAVKVQAININTNVAYSAESNGDGLYRISSVPPGIYRVVVEKTGFAQIVKPNVELHVQDDIALNFAMQVGSISQTVTVEGGAPMVNTTNATVGTVVDQTYIKNMPLNGRSFQDLILLTPGIVTQSAQSGANFNAGRGMTGEFSVNGQRTESNSYTVDGVSANLGAAAGNNMTIGAGSSGSIASATALGTTQALVSVDDLQEFRVQSSTYSAEYGRNPGGQFSFGTRSGANQWHGTASDYLRNDYFGANDWFNDYLNVKQPALRQNDFGGTLGGPVTIPGLYNGKDKTFFFVSYEGLRLIAPQPAAIFGVPNLCLRGQAATTCTDSPAPAELQPVLNAFPVPNGQDFGDGWAEFKGSWSNPSSLDSTSVRFDHVVSDKLRLFFRFSDTGSSASARGTAPGGFGIPPSQNITSAYTMRTYTAGASSLFTNRLSNELRLNYSSNETTGRNFFDAFAGSAPANMAQLTGLGSGSDVFIFLCYDAFCMQPDQSISAGAVKQWNLVDTVSYSVGRHQLKFGADYRRLASHAIQDGSTPFGFPTHLQLPYTLQWNGSIEQALGKSQAVTVSYVGSRAGRLLKYSGILTPTNPNSSEFFFIGNGLTSYYNFAPRLGAAYTLRDTAGWETVLRGGGGVFFDTGQQLASSGFSGPGFSAQSFGGGAPFPQVPQLPTIEDPTTPAGQPYGSTPFGFPTHLQLPYTLQWNGSIEQALGKSQAITVSYVGSRAGRLLKYSGILTPNNPNSSEFFFIGNGLTSYYNSAQVQFRRRLSRGMTALASYTWSHCIDYGSQNYYDFGYQRGNCDFDVRHNFSGAFSYDLPNAGHNRFVNALLHHWGLDDRFTARSGFPVTLAGNSYLDPATGRTFPAGLDLVPNQPIYVYGANCMQIFQNGCPGGRAVNPNAFASVPLDPNTFMPSRAGTAPRNFVRGFGAWQMDLAVRREFPIYEHLALQFRAEAFNVFNHPNFGAVNPVLCAPDQAPNPNNGCTFGQPTGTLANSLGILNPLYQMGGARSMQFALKLIF
ncbi:MAG: TonB-dependent receptor [Acidobacteria bacterium]|nr:MAG: TonB-dependent receptor [Acidobacteriota bacterium]